MRSGNSKKKVYIDEELFKQIRMGDQDAFRELYEVSYKPLYAFLLSLTQNADDAQDLLQDTYIQIHKNCHMYEQNGNPMAWIMKVGKNLFLMKYRKDRVRQFVNYEDMENELGFAQIEDVDNRILLEKMFAQLSQEDRELIIMHDLSGMKFKEIAALVEKPLGTVLARYNRSIRKLQKEFSGR